MSTSSARVARARFEADRADEVQAVVTEEHLRRQRKLANAGEATDVDLVD